MGEEAKGWAQSSPTTEYEQMRRVDKVRLSHQRRVRFVAYLSELPNLWCY